MWKPYVKTIPPYFIVIWIKQIRLCHYPLPQVSVNIKSHFLSPNMNPEALIFCRSQPFNALLREKSREWFKNTWSIHRKSRKMAALIVPHLLPRNWN